MESAILGLTLDSSIVITAERRGLSVEQLIESILEAYGEVELSLSPVTVAELVHGIYRSKSSEVRERRKAYIDDLVSLLPTHPVTVQSAYLVGQIEGEEAAKGNVLPFNDLLIAVAAIEQGYGVLTENVRHFARIPGVRVLRLGLQQP
jgi:tRNA(fMet)-specific endonuclease VapC